MHMGEHHPKKLVALMNASQVFNWAGPFNGSFALHSQQKSVAVCQISQDGCLSQYVANHFHIWQTSGASCLSLDELHQAGTSAVPAFATGNAALKVIPAQA